MITISPKALIIGYKDIEYRKGFLIKICLNRGGNSIFKAVTAPFQACFVELQFYFCCDILLIIRKMLVF